MMSSCEYYKQTVPTCSKQMNLLHFAQISN